MLLRELNIENIKASNMTIQTKTTWRKVKLGEIVEINPFVKLERGKEYPYIDMADVQPFSQISRWSKLKVFNGSGAKFENGDTIFARITPCLENGKIAYISNLNEPGFGSTEFFVMRGKKGISDSRFVYYLSLTHKVRKLAEQSMIGASGRQRVEREAFEQIEIEIPEDPNEQKRIADILSAFDDKIEVNNKIVKTLETMAQEVFKEWFVRFRFPGWEKVKFVDSELGKIPEGWEVKNIMKIIKRLSVDKRYDNRTSLSKGKVPILDQGQSGIIGFHNEEPSFKADSKNPVAVFSNHTCYYRLVTFDFSCIQNVIPYIGINGYSTSFVFYLTKDKIKMSDYKGHWPEFANQKFVIPPQKLAGEYSEIAQPIIEKIDEIKKENQTLAAIRDLLLPKLMSGEVRV
jgi:type I restriction enzyme S subunit